MPLASQATFASQATQPVIFLVLPGVRSSRSTAQAPPAFANFEEAQTNPVRLSADGAPLFALIAQISRADHRCHD